MEDIMQVSVEATLVLTANNLEDGSIENIVNVNNIRHTVKNIETDYIMSDKTLPVTLTFDRDVTTDEEIKQAVYDLLISRKFMIELSNVTLISA